MAKFICSKLASDHIYRKWIDAEKTNSTVRRKERDVFVRGKSGVTDKTTLVTLDGPVTKISDQDFQLLKDSNPVFNRHIERGHLKVLEKEPSASDRAKIVKDLSPDNSAPIDAKSLKKRGVKASVSDAKD